MSSLATLYAAATGMDAQETRINNIANNLANVNTTGFKNSRVYFSDKSNLNFFAFSAAIFRIPDNNSADSPGNERAMLSFFNEELDFY